MERRKNRCHRIQTLCINDVDSAAVAKEFTTVEAVGVTCEYLALPDSVTDQKASGFLVVPPNITELADIYEDYQSQEYNTELSLEHLPEQY